jgi:YbgC/YbaW family acyl-CoA thioester hydrolase
METITEIKVKEEDIDEMDHVNNSVYVKYLEKGRADWYREAGLSFQEMAKHNLGTVVLRLDILYKKEVRLGEVLRVKTIPKKLGNTSFVLYQEIVNEEEEVTTEATVVSVMVNKKERKSTEVANQIASHFPNN